MKFLYTDLEITHLKGGGPGGQNRNKRMTGVRVVHLPTRITVVATERRSQTQNLQAALERIEERVKKRFAVRKWRVATAPSHSSIQKRIEQKKGLAKKKRLRRKRPDFD